MKLLVTILLFAAAALADEDVRYDPEQDFRPKNMTDLAYWLYGWRGS